MIEVREKHAELGVDVRTALDHAIDCFDRAKKLATVAELVAETIDEARRSNLSALHLSDLHTKLGKFSKKFGQRSVATIEASEIADWLEGLGFKDTSFNSCRNEIVAAFSTAVRRGYVTENPASKVSPKISISTGT